MEFDPQDQDIINLLTKLKDVASEYPEPMLVGRRQSFLKQMTEIGLGAGAVPSITNAPGHTHTPGKISPFTSTLLEAALITAIVIETSTMAYFYRGKLASFFETITTNSKIEQGTPLPVVPTSLEIQNVSPSPAATTTLAPATSITESAALMVTSTSTPVPGNTLEANQASSTPDPKGNNGNHYGQTPKPERTKTNNGNNNNNNGNNGNNGNSGSNGNNGNNDKDPKPTKDK